MTAPVRSTPHGQGTTENVARPRRAVLHYGLLMVAVQVLLRIWFLSGSWFYFDDLAFVSAGMNDKLDWDFVGRDYAGHLMPAGWLVIKGLATWAPYNWAVWAAVLVTLQAIASYGMLRLLRSMFGDHPLVLALLAGYLFYVFTLPAGVWFAAGINQLPLQIALVFGLHAHLDYLRTHRLRSLAATLAWTVFGLVFYEKSVILFGLYALVALAWFARGSLGQRVGTLWSSYRAGIVAHGCVAVPYLLIYLTFGLDLGGDGTPNSLLAAVTYRLVFVALSTGAVGGPLNWRPTSANALADPSDLVSLGSWVAVGALVWYAFRTRTISRRAWWLIAFTSAVNVYLLTAARANLVGADIALEYRYQTEAAAVLVLAIGLAFLPLRGAVEINEVRPGIDRPFDQAVPVRLVAGLVVTASLVSALAYVQNWQDNNPTRDYYDNARTGLASARTRPVPLVDRTLPQNLLWAFGYPENTYSHIFRNLAKLTTYPDHSVDELFVLDDKGRVAPVALSPTRTMVPGNGCGYVLDDTPTTIRLDGPVIGGGWWIQMGYAGPRAFDATVRLGETEHTLHFPAGAHTMYLRADGSYDSVVVDNAPEGESACITQLVLGTPSPAPATP